MANLALDYRSVKDRANLEIRFSYKDENDKWRSVRTRSRLKVSKSFWEEYKTVTYFRDPDKRDLKEKIDDLRDRLSDHIVQDFAEAETIDTEWIKNSVAAFYDPVIEKPIPDELVKYWDYYLDLRQHEMKLRSFQKWIEVREKVKRFEDDFFDDEIKIADVNEEFVRDWVEYCEKEGYAHTTTKKNLSYITMICRHAKTKGIEISPELDSVKIRSRKSNLPKVYLSFSELEKIQSLKDLPDRLDTARDWLIISCYTGQRISDFMRFRSEMIRTSKGRKFIDLEQVKTGKRVTVPVVPEVEAILKKRDGNFPKRISDQRYNDYVKEVCKLAGIDQPMRGKIKMSVNGKLRGVVDTYPKYRLISSHVGRRSFATNYYGKVSTNYLKNITGHSKEEILLVYIGKTAQDTAVDAFDQMLNAK